MKSQKKWYIIRYVSNFRGFGLHTTYETAVNAGGIIRKIEKRDDCVEIVSIDLCDDRMQMNKVQGVDESGELVFFNTSITPEFDFDEENVRHKTVGPGNASSARINLPKSWEGEEVVVMKLDKSNTR